MQLLLPLLFACVPTPATEKPAIDTADADTDTDTDTDTDVPVDEDRDGYDSTVDCNDNAYQIYPDAPELCDGVDQDCDDLIDEDFDTDGDGAFSVAACEDGTDCDDTTATIAPGASEVPYDGVDQDCDGGDLTDVDDDGWDGGDGPDCDDADPTVHPGADDIAKDGIDSDCDGVESYDGDGDGYDDEADGGDDCDDLDPDVRPGARDWWNDGADTDCDGSDNSVLALGDAPVTISGTSGAQDLVGEDVAICDLDGDTLLDLVVAAPFGDSYAGQIGIFYGDGAAGWSAGMSLSDADTLIESREQFLGFELGCADLDGDGYQDLVTSRGEIDYYTYITTFELVVWYGDGSKLPATASERDADAFLQMTLGVEPDMPTVFGRSFTVADLDADGASEIVMINSADSRLSEADDAFYVIGGGRYSGDLQLADEASAVIAGEGISAVTPLPDLDGDGVSELLFGETGYGVPTDTGTTDTGDTAVVYGPGRASVVNDDDVATDSLGNLAYGFWEGTGAIALGLAGATGDFDADGLQDVAVSAFAESTYATNGGAVYVFAPAEGAVPAAGSSADADGTLPGGTDHGYFGYQLATASDLDGDGANELVASELFGDATYGRIWLLDGARMVGATTPDAAALLAWSGEAAASDAGNALAVGDLDGDGIDDIVVGAYGYASDGVNANGRVYLLLSGS